MLTLENIAHAFGARPVLDRISFHLEAGQIGCLLGPSGCGKSTLLRLITGFETIQQGRIVLAGETVSGPGQHLPPERRQVGLMFQEYALFPHLSVEDNIGFGLNHLGQAERRQRVRAMLLLVGLQAEAGRYPHQLSGGQQQRVALVRALAPRPRLLLLDEAFSSLDVELRQKLSLEVREIIRQEGITALLVTHDQHEAFALADVVGVMAGGRIQQMDSAYNLYHRPANRFVADFIGQGMFLPGRVHGESKVEIEFGLLQGVSVIECDGGSCLALAQGTAVDVLIRPDDIVHDDASTLLAEVEYKVFRGADFIYTLILPSGDRVLAQVPSHHNHAIGEMIGIRLEVKHVVAFTRMPAQESPGPD